MIKTTEWGILFNQNPRRYHQVETRSTKDEGFLPWWFLRGFWLNRIPKSVVFNFYPAISWIYIFMGSYYCFHIAIYLRFFTSDLICLNAHLNCLSLDIQATTIEHILSVIHYTIYGAVCSVYPVPVWWLREYILCLIIIIKLEVWTIIHCLGLGHETMVCAVCLPILLWQCHVTMTRQWGHVTKQILNLAGWGQISWDWNEWFNHYLVLIRS